MQAVMRPAVWPGALPLLLLLSLLRLVPQGRQETPLNVGLFSLQRRLSPEAEQILSELMRETAVMLLS